jgi:CheY-like chemotaxis protein
MNSQKYFIIVDDDPIDIMVCKRAIKVVPMEVENDIQSFTDPAMALAYIQEMYAENVEQRKTILFLDINMPGMDGWEFLESYDSCNDHVKKQINIFIHSSSIDERDHEKAKQSPHVIDFIEKPLSAEQVIACLKTVKEI